VEELKEKRPERISHNWPYLKDGYIYTLDEVEQEFKSELEKAKQRLANAEQNIKDFEANFWKFEKLAGDVVNFLDAMPDGIYYTFKTILKENV
jgi:glutamyl-tRNA reductase